jgi:hypothetical protein
MKTSISCAAVLFSTLTQAMSLETALQLQRIEVISPVTVNGKYFPGTQESAGEEKRLKSVTCAK